MKLIKLVITVDDWDGDATTLIDALLLSGYRGTLDVKPGYFPKEYNICVNTLEEFINLFSKVKELILKGK